MSFQDEDAENSSAAAANPIEGPHPELSDGRRWAILFVFVLSAMVSILSQLTMTASLPSIMAEFGISATLAQWLTTGYMLSLGIMVPCSGFFMTRFQSRHLLLAAGLVFLTGIFGAFATSFAMLLVVRCVQGLAAGILIPLMQVVVFRLFPPNKRGFAMGVASVAIAAGPALGPVIAGVCTQLWGWRSVFVVVAVLTLGYLACYPVVHAFREQTGEASFDVLSLIEIAVGFASLTIGASNLGAGDVQRVLLEGVLPIAVAVLALIAFARRQFSLEQPLLDLRPFRNARFTLGCVAVMVIFGALVNVEVFISLYLQTDQGYSSTVAGMSLLGGTVVSAIIAPFTGRMLDRKGPLGISIVGFSLLVVSGILQSLVTVSTPFAYTFIVFTIRGAGNACVMQHLQTWAINSLEPQLMTHGSAIANSMRQMGGALFNSLLFSLMAVVAAGSSELVGIDVAVSVSTTLVAVVGAVAIAMMVRARKG